MTFGEWIQKELDKRGWDQAELSRRGDITSSQVSRIMSGLRNPGIDACSAIAHAFNLPEEIVFREAGLLAARPAATPALEEAQHLLSQLCDADQQIVLAQTRALLELRRNCESDRT